MAHGAQREAAGAELSPGRQRAYRAAFGVGVALFAACVAAGLGYRALVERRFDAHFRFLDEADALLAAGEYQRAADKYRVAVAIPQLDTLAASRLATALDAAGDASGTAEALREVLRLGPGNRPARIQLGISLARAGRSEESLVELAPLLEAEPADPEVLAAAGYALLRGGRNAEAITQLERALQLDPGNALARASLDRLIEQYATGQLPPPAQPSKPAGATRP